MLRPGYTAAAPGVIVGGKLPMLCCGYTAAAPGVIVGGKLPMLCRGYTAAAPGVIVGGRLPMLSHGDAPDRLGVFGDELAVLGTACPVAFARDFCRRHSV